MDKQTLLDRKPEVDTDWPLPGRVRLIAWLAHRLWLEIESIMFQAAEGPTVTVFQLGCFADLVCLISGASPELVEPLRDGLFSADDLLPRLSFVLPEWTPEAVADIALFSTRADSGWGDDLRLDMAAWYTDLFSGELAAGYVPTLEEARGFCQLLVALMLLPAQLLQRNKDLLLENIPGGFIRFLPRPFDLDENAPEEDSSQALPTPSDQWTEGERVVVITWLIYGLLLELAAVSAESWSSDTTGGLVETLQGFVVLLRFVCLGEPVQLEQHRSLFLSPDALLPRLPLDVSSWTAVSIEPSMFAGVVEADWDWDRQLRLCLVAWYAELLAHDLPDHQATMEQVQSFFMLLVTLLMAEARVLQYNSQLLFAVTEDNLIASLPLPFETIIPDHEGIVATTSEFWTEDERATVIRNLVGRFRAEVQKHNPQDWDGNRDRWAKRVRGLANLIACLGLADAEVLEANRSPILSKVQLLGRLPLPLAPWELPVGNPSLLELCPALQWSVSDRLCVLSRLAVQVSREIFQGCSPTYVQTLDFCFLTYLLLSLPAKILEVNRHALLGSWSDGCLSVLPVHLDLQGWEPSLAWVPMFEAFTATPEEASQPRILIVRTHL